MEKILKDVFFDDMVVLFMICSIIDYLVQCEFFMHLKTNVTRYILTDFYMKNVTLV